MKLALPSNIGDYLSKNLYQVLAGVFIVILALGYLLFLTGNILPAVRERADTAEQLAQARNQLAQKQTTQNISPDDLRGQIAQASSTLSNTFAALLPDGQAGQLVDGLYQKALANGVAIVDFQTQVTSYPPEKTLYTQTDARIKVQGQTFDLVQYVSALNELAVKGVLLSSLAITNGQPLGNMVLDVTLFTSPFAPQQDTAPIIALPPIGQPVPIATAVPVVPVIPPTAVPPAPRVDPALLAQMAQPLNDLWQAQNWPEAIKLIEQIRVLDPNYADMTLRLYAAHVNYGYQFQARGQIENAIAEFGLALQIMPDGAEAQAALRALVPTPTP